MYRWTSTLNTCAGLEEKKKEATAALAELIQAAGSTLDGLSTRSVAELLVEVGESGPLRGLSVAQLGLWRGAAARLRARS